MQERPAVETTGRDGIILPPDPVIPRQVASPDGKVCRTAGRMPGEIQNPPNAPAGSRPLSLTAWSVKTTANQLENKSILWHNRISETSILLVHQSVHLLVLKAPIDGGFKRAS
jgi:hypothetical protein